MPLVDNALMLLFFDTETTGLPRDHSAPASDVDNWPRIVQIAWLITDESGAEKRSQSFIISPAGFEIPAEASRIHGITTARARNSGVQLARVLKPFAADVDASRMVVAHNLEFDSRVVAAEYFRTGVKKSPFDGKTQHCTMRSSTSFCQIPGGPRGYKWPTLMELHRKLFGEEFGSAHDALADVRACAKCYFELNRQGIRPGDAGSGSADAPDPDDQKLFDEIYSLAEMCTWFDTGRFVDDVYSRFQERRRISAAQRNALENIRSMLEDKAG